MRTSVRLLALLSLACGNALAEPEWSGRWRAVFATDQTEALEAEVVIDATAGTWKTSARDPKSRRDRCFGGTLSFVLQDSGSSTVTLLFEGSKVVPGCRDRTARLTAVDDQTLEGEFDNGRVVRLERRAVRK